MKPRAYYFSNRFSVNHVIKLLKNKNCSKGHIELRKGLVLYDSWMNILVLKKESHTAYTMALTLHNCSRKKSEIFIALWKPSNPSKTNQEIDLRFIHVRTLRCKRGNYNSQQPRKS